jgi:biopolymer transport protein ExbD
MAKTRFLDVWIVELKTVYREVPFAVVTDWLQQGRLLTDDRVRLSGTADWRIVGKIPTLAAFLPKPEPGRADDQAEALEPVETGFRWHRRGEEEDDDVDMIPLIDISLVLLIFFMMTASVTSGIASPIPTPGAKHQLAAISKDMFFVGIDLKGPKGEVEKGADGKPLPWYSFGKETKQTMKPAQDLGAVRQALKEAVDKEDLIGEVRVRLRGHREATVETINAVTLEIQGLELQMNRERPAERKISFTVLGEVSEPQ